MRFMPKIAPEQWIDSTTEDGGMFSYSHYRFRCTCGEELRFTVCRDTTPTCFGRDEPEEREVKCRHCGADYGTYWSC